jgi:hypothetical protein
MQVSLPKNRLYSRSRTDRTGFQTPSRAVPQASDERKRGHAGEERTVRDAETISAVEYVCACGSRVDNPRNARKN